MFVIPTATLAAVMWSPMLTGPASSPREVSIIQCLGTAEIARIRNSTLMRSIYITRELLTTKVPIWTHKHKLSTKQNFDGFSLSLSLTYLLIHTLLLTISLSLFLSLTVQLAIKRSDIFTTLFYLSLSHFCLFENGVSLFHFPTYRYLLLFLYISISHNLMSIYPTHSPPLSFIQNPFSTYQPIRPYSHVGHFSIMRHLNIEACSKLDPCFIFVDFFN